MPDKYFSAAEEASLLAEADYYDFSLDEIELQPTCEICGHIGCEGNHRASATEGTSDEAATLQAERDALATAVVSAAVRVGITDGTQPLTGPQLIMLCEDLAKAASAVERFRERAVAKCHQVADQCCREPACEALAAIIAAMPLVGEKESDGR